jgi:hypothetical protein
MSEIQQARENLAEKRQALYNLTSNNLVINKDGKDFNILYDEYNEACLRFGRAMIGKDKMVNNQTDGAVGHGNTSET